MNLAGESIFGQALDRGAEGADPREPRRRNAAPRRRDARARSRGASEVLRLGIGRRLLRPARRPGAAAKTRRPARTSSPKSAASGRRPRSRPRPLGVRVVLIRTGIVLGPGRRRARPDAADLQDRRRRPDRVGQAVHVVDPPRRPRRRSCSTRSRRRRSGGPGERHRPRARDEQGLREDAREGPAPAGVHPDPARSRSARVRRIRRHPRDGAAGGARAGARERVRLRVPDLEPALRDCLRRR